MKRLTGIFILMLGLSVSACAKFDPPTRNAPISGPAMVERDARTAPRDYQLAGLRFTVPTDLEVSEANAMFPMADIVWRGEPIGDRRRQIAAIFDEAVTAAGARLTGATPVVVEVNLLRFHGLTERARYSIGGRHNIKFDLTIRHAETGAILEETTFVRADLDALGGDEALRAEQAGQGQRVRILAHLTALFQDRLTGMPGQETYQGS